uniref:Uncharacterized protein n=1 Tax=Rhizophora mucronata TaxID=61149 RepID=A0A2P2PGB9_RHIMU
MILVDSLMAVELFYYYYFKNFLTYHLVWKFFHFSTFIDYVVSIS